MNWTLLFSFEGRVGRGAYWGLVAASLVLFGALSAFGVMSALSSPEQAADGGTGIAMPIASLAILWPALAIQAKRWHDVDKSAWWILIGLVPLVGGFVTLAVNGFVAGTPGTNRFGPAPDARTRSRAVAAGA